MAKALKKLDTLINETTEFKKIIDIYFNCIFLMFAFLKTIAGVYVLLKISSKNMLIFFKFSVNFNLFFFFTSETW